MVRPLPIAFATAVLWLAAAGTCWSQSPTQGQQIAHDLIRKANQSFQDADYVHALEYYQMAYKLAPSPMLHFNMGLAHEELHESVAALDSFRSFLREAPNASDTLRAQARARVEALRGKVGMIKVICSPEGASVALDGLTHGTTPLTIPIAVTPGTHEVIVSKEAHSDSRTKVRVLAGRELQVKCTLSPVVRTAPNGEVAPPIAKSAIERNGPAISKQFRPREHRGARIAGGLAAGLGITGLAVGAWTRSSYRDVSASGCAGTTAGCNVSGLKQKNLATNLLLGSAGVAALTAVALYIFSGHEGKREPVTTLVPTGDGAVLTFHCPL